MELINEFKNIFNREISNLDEIDSIELVILVNTLNAKFSKSVDMFEVIECLNLEEINDLFFKQ